MKARVRKRKGQIIGSQMRSKTCAACGISGVKMAVQNEKGCICPECLAIFKARKK